MPIADIRGDNTMSAKATSLNYFVCSGEPAAASIVSQGGMARRSVLQITFATMWGVA